MNDMIGFSREYENIGVAEPVWQNCHSLIDIASKQILMGGTIVKNDLPPDGEVFADPLIFRVFCNLIDNAMRHGEKITTLCFSVIDRAGSRVIVCEDDGVGILAGEKEKIFEQGFGKNTGMGLFLSREILEITGITIRETGEYGRGARFEITLPPGAFRIVALPRAT
jgi:signal transduction histidine kinase